MTRAERMQSVLDVIKRAGKSGINQTNLRNSLGISRASCGRYIKDLKSANLIRSASVEGRVVYTLKPKLAERKKLTKAEEYDIKVSLMGHNERLAYVRCYPRPHEQPPLASPPLHSSY